VFDSFPSSLVHQESTWEISTASDFSSIEISSVGDTVNLTAITFPDGVSEVVTITLDQSPEIGTYELVFGAEIALINFDDAVGDIETKLNALPLIDSVTVAGDSSSSYTITFGGSQEKSTLVSTITVQNNTLRHALSPEQQQVIISPVPDIGEYVLNVIGSDTSPILFDDDLATIESKISAALPAGGTVALSGTPENYTLLFGGTLSPDNQPPSTVTANSLTQNIKEVQNVVLDTDFNTGTYDLSYDVETASILDTDLVSDIENKLNALSDLPVNVTVSVTGTNRDYNVEFTDSTGIEADRDLLSLTPAAGSGRFINEQQTVALSGGTPNGGSYRLNIGGEFATISFNTPLATIESSLNALTAISAAGGVSLSGSPQSYTVDFLSAGSVDPLVVSNNSLNNTTSSSSSSSKSWTSSGDFVKQFNTTTGAFSTSFGNNMSSSIASALNVYAWAGGSNSLNNSGTLAFESRQLIFGQGNEAAVFSDQSNGSTTAQINAFLKLPANSTSISITWANQGIDFSTQKTIFTWYSNSGAYLGGSVRDQQRNGLVTQTFSLPAGTRVLGVGRFTIGFATAIRSVSVAINSTTVVQVFPNAGTVIDGEAVPLTGLATAITDGASNSSTVTPSTIADGTFTPVVIDDEQTVLGQTNGNLPAGQYYGRVKYKADNGGESSYSVGQPFNIV